MKKLMIAIVSIILCVAVFLCPLCVSARESSVNGLLSEFSKTMLGVEKVKISATDKAFSRQLSENMTEENISDILKSVFLIEKDKAETISDEIVSDSQFTVTVLDNGKSTVYIGVDLEKHPELMNTAVFLKTMKKLCEKQGEYAEPVESFDLMTYEHIAGETALHIAVYVLTKALKNDVPDTPLYRFFQSSRFIELNIDEGRLPCVVIRLIGAVIIGILNIFVPA